MLAVDLVIVGSAVLIAVIAVTVIYAFVARVPYVPTPMTVVRAMIGLARMSGSETVFDLGAGNGKILIETKRRYPDTNTTGIEIGPTVWLLGRLNIFLHRQRIHFLRRNALTCDLRNADVIFLYLCPSVMADLEKKFDRELRPGTVVISHAFTFPHKEPQEVLKVRHWNGLKTVRRYQW